MNDTSTMKTIGTITNTNADNWLVKLRGGNIIGFVSAPADDVEAALDRARSKYQAHGHHGPLSVVRRYRGVYSVRSAG